VKHPEMWGSELPVGLSEDILNDLACLAAKHAGECGPEMIRLLRRREYGEFLTRKWVSYGEDPLPFGPARPRILVDAQGVARVEVKDISHDRVQEIRWARQALAFFQKYEPLDIGVDKRQAALDSWFAYEEACRATNELLVARAEGNLTFSARNEWILRRITRRIARTLGAAPQLGQLKLRYGPGATVLITKREASILRKLGTTLDCSEDLIELLPKLLEELPLLTEYHGVSYTMDRDGVKRYGDSEGNLELSDDVEEWASVPVEVTCGILSFVLKNFQTFRTVEKQPILNTLLQLALGDEMSRRCRSKGLDLTDQKRNRIAAWVGSLTGALATLDLKGASDTNAHALVMETYPSDWYALLEACRVGRVADPRRPGGQIGLEKFSAMGNGYTFPVESLIFWALAHASLEYWEVVEEETVQNRTIEVYGDDMIVPTEIVDIVHDALHAFGFILNKEKSYWLGSFRESCGADYLSGTDIRPVFAKEALSPASLFTLHNGLRARGMHELAAYCERRIPAELRLYGPPGYGDGVLHSEAWPRTRTSEHLSRGFEGSTFRSFQRVPKRDIRPEYRPGEELLPAYQAYARSAEDLIPASVNLKLGNFETLRRLRKRREDNTYLASYALSDRFTVEAPSAPLPWHKSVVTRPLEPLDERWLVSLRASAVRTLFGTYEFSEAWEQALLTYVSENCASNSLSPEEASEQERVCIKAPTFPGTDGVKVVSNYVLE